MKLIKWRKVSRVTLDVDGSSTRMQPLLQDYPMEDLSKKLAQSIRTGHNEHKKSLSAKKVNFESEMMQNDDLVKKKSAKGINKEEGDIFRANLAKEFVKVKTEKLNWMSKLYIYLNNKLVTKIMLKNEKE